MEINVTVYREERARQTQPNERGEVIPLVLIHGFPVDHRMWDAAAKQVIIQTEKDERLSQVPVFSFEMPGAGTTPVPSEGEYGEVAEDGAYPQALDAMSAAFVERLQSMGYSKAVWVGLSMGGYVVLAIQRLFPEAVAGLGICDSKPDADSPSARENRLKVAEEAEAGIGWRSVIHFAEPMQNDSLVKKSSAFILAFTEWIHDQTSAGIAWRERMAAGRPDQTEVLADIEAPTLLLSGELDPSSPPEKMRPYLSQIRNSFFIEVAQAGHFTAVEQPRETAAALVELLKRVGA